MTTTRRLAATLATLALSTAGVAVAASPAQAVNNCPNSNFCGFVDINYATGQGAEFNPTSTGCETVVFPNAWSSYWNSSGRTVRVYKTSNCTSSYLTVANGTGDSHLSIHHVGWDNAIKSFRWS